MRNCAAISLLVITIFLSNSPCAEAYSILTHEAIIDANWEKSIYPLLKKRFPNATEEQLKKAHAYTYGGAIAPDMGYFPFGNVFFTELVHYVRSGDFVSAMLSEARDVNEYAFALGFLCHYMADRYGHSLGTNRCVPLMFPRERKEHGDIVTYDEDHVSHKRVEFSFDVLEIAKGNYTSMAYHDFIGFEVSRPVLERAFDKTYGLDLNTVLNDLAIETFRWSVNNLMPVLTKSAWAARNDEIHKLNPTATSRSYVYKFKNKDYDKEFGHKRQKPGPLAMVVAVFIRVSPKVGPLRLLKFKSPGPQGEKLFTQSFDSVSYHYASALHRLGSGSMKLENVDFDTGKLTASGEYPPADKSYSKLLLSLKEKNFDDTNHALRQNILDFYSHRTPKPAKKNTKACKQITAALEQLKREPNSLSHNK